MKFIQSSKFIQISLKSSLQILVLTHYDSLSASRKKLTRYKYFGPSLIRLFAQIKLQECNMEIALTHVQQVFELSCKIEIENLYYRIMPSAKRIQNITNKIERTESQICIFRPRKKRLRKRRALVFYVVICSHAKTAITIFMLKAIHAEHPQKIHLAFERVKDGYDSTSIACFPRWLF